MSDRELKLKGNQNFDEIREIYEKISELEKKFRRLHIETTSNRTNIQENVLLIAEMVNLMQKIGVKTDFTSDESGQALKEIADLKEGWKCLNGRISDLNTWREGVNKGLGVHLDQLLELKEKLDGKDSEGEE